MALIGSTLSFAQKEAKMSVDEKSEKITSKLTDELGLSPSQSKEIKALHVDLITNQRSIKANTSLSKDQKKEQITELRKSKKTKMESILSKEQQNKLAELHKKNKGNKKKKATPQERAEKRTAKLDELVSLTPSQRTSVMNSNLETLKAVNKIKKDDALSEEDKKLKDKALKKNNKNKINSILTKEQKAILKEKKKEHQEKNKDK